MSQAYALSESTKAALENVLSESPGATFGNGGGGGVRQVVHVRITSEYASTDEDTAGYYDCVPTVYSPQDDEWTDYDSALVIEATGKPLEKDQVYSAVRYGYLAGYGEDGDDATTIVYVATTLSQRVEIVRCGDWTGTPDGCYNLYHGSALILDTQAWTTSEPAVNGIVKLTALECHTLQPGSLYFALWNGWDGGVPVFVCVGEVYGSSSGAGGSGSGAGVEVVTDVTCASGGLHRDHKTLTGSVSIGGRTYPVTFALA